MFYSNVTLLAWLDFRKGCFPVFLLVCITSSRKAAWSPFYLVLHESHWLFLFFPIRVCDRRVWPEVLLEENSFRWADDATVSLPWLQWNSVDLKQLNLCMLRLLSRALRLPRLTIKIISICCRITEECG